MFATCFQMLQLRVCIHAPTHAHLCPHRRRQAHPLLSPFASQILSFVQTEALWQPRVQQVCRQIFPHFAHFMSLSYFADSHNVWSCSLLSYQFWYPWSVIFSMVVLGLHTLTLYRMANFLGVVCSDCSINQLFPITPPLLSHPVP